jgi:steroid delta-isomerase-like uncharacterized protein
VSKAQRRDPPAHLKEEEVSAPAPPPVETARRAFAALNTRDADEVMRFHHPDNVNDFVAIGAYPGREAIRGFFRDLFTAFPDFDVTVDRITGDEHTAVVQWLAAGTFSGGPFLGIQPTGRRVDIRGVDVMDIEDGLIVHNTIYYDGATFARQVGLLPRAGTRPDRAILTAFNSATRLRARFRRRD